MFGAFGASLGMLSRAASCKTQNMLTSCRLRQDRFRVEPSQTNEGKSMSPALHIFTARHHQSHLCNSNQTYLRKSRFEAWLMFEVLSYSAAVSSLQAFSAQTPEVVALPAPEGPSTQLQRYQVLKTIAWLLGAYCHPMWVLGPSGCTPGCTPAPAFFPGRLRVRVGLHFGAYIHTHLGPVDTANEQQAM